MKKRKIVFNSPVVLGFAAICLVFAFILLSSFTSFKDGEIPLTFVLVAVLYIGQQVVQGITLNDNVSNMAHIIGGIVGGAVGYGLNKKK